MLGCESDETVRRKKPLKDEVSKSTSAVVTKIPAPPPPPPPPPGPPLPPPPPSNVENDEDKLKVECRKFYARPALKKMDLLQEPLR